MNELQAEFTSRKNLKDFLQKKKNSFLGKKSVNQTSPSGLSGFDQRSKSDHQIHQCKKKKREFHIDKLLSDFTVSSSELKWEQR